MNDIEKMRMLGYTWHEIGQVFKKSPTQLRRKTFERAYNEQYGIKKGKNNPTNEKVG